MNRWMNRWMNEWIDEWMNESMNEWIVLWIFQTLLSWVMSWIHLQMHTMLNCWHPMTTLLHDQKNHNSNSILNDFQTFWRKSKQHGNMRALKIGNWIDYRHITNNYAYIMITSRGQDWHRSVIPAFNLLIFPAFAEDNESLVTRQNKNPCGRLYDKFLLA